MSKALLYLLEREQQIRAYVRSKPQESARAIKRKFSISGRVWTEMSAIVTDEKLRIAKGQ